MDRGRPIAWPPCSSDLNPLDFYLWGHLKSFVCLSPVDDVKTIRNRIVASFQTLRNIPGIWDRLRVAMRHQAESYIQAGGAHMEHLLEELNVIDRPQKLGNYAFPDLI
jgi:hypothetical protein